MNNIYLYAAIVAVLLTMTLVGLFLHDLYKNRNALPHPKKMQEGIKEIFDGAFDSETKSPTGEPDCFEIKLKELHQPKRVCVKVTPYSEEVKIK